MNTLQIYLLVMTIIVGLCVGSFLNVVIYRLPNHMSLSNPPSHCPNCNYKLKWYDNIPVFSFLFLRGKCRNCGQKISIRYPIIEILNMLMWFLCLVMFTDIIVKTNENDYVMFGVSILACSTLLCVFCCDLEHLEIPDELQVMLLILGLVSMFSNSILATDRVLGFLIGGGFFAFIYYLFYFIKKRECLGWGDVKLIAVCGLILGYQKTILCIILSSVFGAIILLILSLSKKEESNKEYPFATFIVPACIFSMLFGGMIISWYLSLFAI